MTTPTPKSNIHIPEALRSLIDLNPWKNLLSGLGEEQWQQLREASDNALALSRQAATSVGKQCHEGAEFAERVLTYGLDLAQEWSAAIFHAAEELRAAAKQAE